MTREELETSARTKIENLDAGDKIPLDEELDKVLSELGWSDRDRLSFPIRSRSWVIVDHFLLILEIMIVSDRRSHILWVIVKWSAITEPSQNSQFLSKKLKKGVEIMQFKKKFEKIYVKSRTV